MPASSAHAARCARRHFRASLFLLPSKTREGELVIVDSSSARGTVACCGSCRRRRGPRGCSDLDDELVGRLLERDAHAGPVFHDPLAGRRNRGRPRISICGARAALRRGQTLPTSAGLCRCRANVSQLVDSPGKEWSRESVTMPRQASRNFSPADRPIIKSTDVPRLNLKIGHRRSCSGVSGNERRLVIDQRKGNRIMNTEHRVVVGVALGIAMLGRSAEAFAEAWSPEVTIFPQQQSLAVNDFAVNSAGNEVWVAGLQATSFAMTVTAAQRMLEKGGAHQRPSRPCAALRRLWPLQSARTTCCCDLGGRRRAPLAGWCPGGRCASPGFDEPSPILSGQA